MASGFGCSENNNSKKEKVVEENYSLDNILRKQILLTNHATFTNERELVGASAFLIEYMDKVYAVTAKHLIGEAGGVEPEVNQTHLDEELKKWQMFPRVTVISKTDTITANAQGLNFNDNTSDALLLNTVGFKSGIQPLKPDFTEVKEGDSLFIIGCPYSEPNCRQNIYKTIFVGRTESGFLVSTTDEEVELRGFSGAPVVNSSGYVVGIIYGGGLENGKMNIYTTSIKEIRKIK